MKNKSSVYGWLAIFFFAIGIASSIVLIIYFKNVLFAIPFLSVVAYDGFKDSYLKARIKDINEATEDLKVGENVGREEWR